MTSTLILAIEPDKRQAAHLTSMARHTLKAEIILADSAERALASLGDRVPDLILTPALLPPRDEAAIAERLRQLNSRAAHVQTLTVPVLAAPKRNSPARGVLSALRRDKSADGPADGCDPAVFAEQVADYLERATAERAAHVAAAEREPHAAVVAAAPAPAVEHAAAFDADPYVASVPRETVAEPTAAYAESLAVDEWNAPEPAVEHVQNVASVPSIIIPERELAERVPEAVLEAAAAPAVADPDPYVATVLDTPSASSPIESDPFVADAADAYAEPADRVEMTAAAAAPATAPAVHHETEVLPVLEFLVANDAALALEGEASLDSLDLVELADPLPDLAGDGFDGFDPQMLSALLPDAYPVLEVVSDELDAIEEAAADPDEIDLAPLLETGHESQTAPPLEAAGAAAIIAAVAAIERSMASSAAPPPEKTANAWVPLRFESHPLWPPMEGVAAEPPASGAVVAEPAPVDIAVRQPTPLKKKKAKAKPAQDEWGLFDPAQCGFAALLAKLEEITEKEDARSA